MSGFEGTYNMSSGGEDSQEQSGRYPPGSHQHNMQIMGCSSPEQHYWNGTYQESCMPTGDASSINPWSWGAFSDPSVSMYGGSVQYPGDACLESLIGSTGGEFMEMQTASPISEQAPAVIHTALPNWNQIADPLRPSWDHPAHASRPYSDHTSYHDMRDSIPPLQPTTSLMATGRLEGSADLTGHPPSIIATSYMQHPVGGEPVSAALPTPRPRGERWDLPNGETFQCLWMSSERRCMAPISGDRRSVTNHLRDTHGFTCDGQVITCAWDQCMTSMQRRNIPRHIVACHFGIKVPCSRCGMPLSRADANRKHQLACTGGGTVEAAEEDTGVYF